MQLRDRHCAYISKLMLVCLLLQVFFHTWHVWTVHGATDSSHILPEEVWVEAASPGCDSCACLQLLNFSLPGKPEFLWAAPVFSQPPRYTTDFERLAVQPFTRLRAPPYSLACYS